MSVPDISDELSALRNAVDECDLALLAIAAIDFTPFLPEPLGSLQPGVLAGQGTAPVLLNLDLLIDAVEPMDSFNDVLVAVLDPAALPAIRTTFTDEVQVPFPGPDPREPAGVTRARDVIEATDELLSDIVVRLRLFSDPATSQALSAGTITDRVTDIAAYPMLTTDVVPSRVDGFGGGGGGGSGGGDLTAIVDTAIRSVIGRLPRHTDAVSFTAALTSSFGITDHDGVRAVGWRPRGYGGPAELGGGVTGAQASLYARVKDAVDGIEPLLAGLQPLKPDADIQEMDAARSVLRTELLEVLDELAIEGGPRRSRVDQLIEALVTEAVVGPEGAIGRGVLGYLGNAFGYALADGEPTDRLVNTIEEEQQFSNYVLLADYLNGIETSWTTFKLSYPDYDFGTRLVLLSRALQVVAESVDQVEDALDSVFVGAAERGVTQFRDAGGSPMLVSELLSWTQRFATDEAPTLVREGGRRGLGPVVSTADRLVGHIERLQSAIASDPTLPSGLRHPRVANPLQELVAYLRRVSQLASSVKVPQP